jgi:uncharacterized protein YuzE
MLDRAGLRIFALTSPQPQTEAREIVEGLVVDFDANGEVVGFDVGASFGKRRGISGD